MSDTSITAITTQTDHYRTYQAGDCSTVGKPVVSCGEDWFIRKVSCTWGSDQHRCSRLDPATCPDTAGGAIARWDGSPQVSCTYRVSGFTTPADVNVYKLKWGEDSNYNRVIMPAFCALPSQDCQDNSGSCTNLQDTGEAGTLCQEWASKTGNIPLIRLDPPAGPSFWVANKWVVVGVAVAILVIVIIFTVVSSTSRKSTSKIIKTK
jgi:hypothetical protein